MTRDDIRKLIGGYATGSLTESQRKLLFEAALEDQELFDELAREQSLKELIEEPGARERLIAALDSRKPEAVWWKQTWPWAAAAALCLAVVVLVTIVPHRQSRPVDVALVTAPPPQPPAAVPPAANAPVVKQAARPNSAPRPVKEKDQPATRRDETSEDLKVKAEASVSAPVAGGAPPSALPAVPPAQQTAAPSPRVQQQAFDTTQNTAQKRELQAQLGAAMNKIAPFAFTYKIEPEGYVTVAVLGDGYLRVETPALPPIANDLHVANATTRLKIPDGAQELTITFAAALPSVKGKVAAGKLAGAGGRRANADALAVKKDELSGMIEDPNPSPNSRLVVTVQLH